MCGDPEDGQRAIANAAKRGQVVRRWCEALRKGWTRTNPQVGDLGVRGRAGDENRTRALSLEINGSWSTKVALNCMFDRGGEVGLVSGHRA